MDLCYVSSLRDVALPFLGILSFFGTRNVASINTFNPNMIYSISVFSPFVMYTLLVLKMAVAFVFGSSVFNVILSLLSRRIKTTRFLMLVMSDLTGHNFFLVLDSLEIGGSISHYVIMMKIAVAWCYEWVWLNSSLV